VIRAGSIDVATKSGTKQRLQGAVFIWRIVVASTAMLFLGGCDAQTPATQSVNTGTASADVYQTGRASRDGIGKFYMGREISHVMGHQGAGWLERPDREREERTDLLISNLPIDSNSVVADVGSGTGYFSLPMAAIAKNGTVYAADLQPEMLEIVSSRALSMGLSNIVAVQATETDPMLPANSVDMVLLVDAYHEFNQPFEVMSAIYSSLKPGGQVVLIEYRAEDPRVPIKPLHKMSQEQAILELSKVGLEWQETLDILPQQHFMIFTKPR
jgi:ubiquinone/menaquinone biosynthesis C-methylase UbiE